MNLEEILSQVHMCNINEINFIILWVISISLTENKFSISNDTFENDNYIISIFF